MYFITIDIPPGPATVRNIFVDPRQLNAWEIDDDIAPQIHSVILS